MKSASFLPHRALAAGLVLFAAVLTASSALAQELGLPWYAFGSGGGTSSGDGTQLAGTIGLPIVGVSSGEGARLEAGFWLTAFPSSPKILPALEWPAPAPIAYGTPLSGTELAARADVPGTFTYTPAGGVVLDAGFQTLKADFVPTDALRYRSASISVQLQVLPAPQTILFGALPDRVFGDGVFALEATGGGSGQTVLFASDNPAVISINGNLATIRGAGTAVITASQAGTANYLPADNVPRSLTVRPAEVVVRADDLSIAAGQSLPPLTYQTIGLVPPDTVAVFSPPVKLTTTATPTSPPGGYPIVPSEAAAANYQVLFAAGTLTIRPAELVSIQVQPSVATLATGQSQAFAATGTFTDGTSQALTTGVTWTSGNPGVASVNGSGVVSAVSPGTAAIRADRGGVSGAATLTVISGPVVTQFANTGSLTIPPSGPASAYPSTLGVSGLGGSISRITAQLRGLTHARPDDLDVLLVGPGGQRVLLQSDCGDSLAVTGLTITYDDAAPASLPNTTRIQTGSYRPTNYGGNDKFPSPAPKSPYAGSLSVFNGTNPNGQWSLFVFDDQNRNQGVIAGGWSLTITTSPGGALTTARSRPGVELQGRWVDGASTAGGLVPPTFHLQLRSAGGWVVIETSTDMVHWTRVEQVEAGEGEVNRFEPVDPADGQRFYRARRIEAAEIQ